MEFKDFTKADWNSFAGAEFGPLGELPKIAWTDWGYVLLDGTGLTVAFVDPERDETHSAFFDTTWAYAHVISKIIPEKMEDVEALCFALDHMKLTLIDKE